MGRLVALLDLGSSASRLVLARLEGPGRVQVLETTRVRSRLGAVECGRLALGAIDATVAAAEPFLARAEAQGAALLAIATSAVRDASNRDELLRALSRSRPLDVRVLSEREEAELGAEAALAQHPMQHGLVADLGGGSLQITRIVEGRVAESASSRLGSVRLTAEYLKTEPPALAELAVLRAAVRAELARMAPAGVGAGQLVMLGGSARAIARCVAEGTPGASESVLRLPDLSAFRAEIETMTHDERKRVPGLDAHRVDVVVAGAVVLEELLRRTGFGELVVSTASVREAVLRREAALLAPARVRAAAPVLSRVG